MYGLYTVTNHLSKTSPADLSRNPLSGYSADRPKPGDLVRGWVYGPIFQGYWLDPGRTAVCGGKPTNAQKEVVEGCAHIVEEIAKVVRPGVSTHEVARLGDRLTAEVGGGKYRGSDKFPVYGHGIGLSWERPIIGLAYGEPDEPIEENMVIGIEAFLGTEAGAGSAGFESNYIVGKDGVELLTKTRMIWW